MMVSEGASTNLKFHLKSVCLRSTNSFELLWEMVRAQEGDQEDAMHLSTVVLFTTACSEAVVKIMKNQPKHYFHYSLTTSLVVSL